MMMWISSIAFLLVPFFDWSSRFVNWPRSRPTLRQSCSRSWLCCSGRFLFGSWYCRPHTPRRCLNMINGWNRDQDIPWCWWWWRWLRKWECLLTPHMCLFDWNWSRSQGKHVRNRQISPRRASELNLWSHPALTHCPPMHLLNVSTPQGVPSDTEAARR